MKSILYAVLVGSIMVLSAFTVQQSINWKIADGYSIKFSASSAKGIFKTLTGDIQFDEEDLASSKCVLEIDISSINTGNGMKNKHAKSDKWFDAENHPLIEFQSNKFSKTENGYSVTGIMKIHGIEKEMTIPFTNIDNVFTSTFSVNRLDFKVGTTTGTGKKVSNEIKLEVSIPVTKI